MKRSSRFGPDDPFIPDLPFDRKKENSFAPCSRPPGFEMARSRQEATIMIGETFRSGAAGALFARAFRRT